VVDAHQCQNLRTSSRFLSVLRRHRHPHTPTDPSITQYLATSPWRR